MNQKDKLRECRDLLQLIAESKASTVKLDFARRYLKALHGGGALRASTK